MTPAHSAVEETTSAWLLDLLGLPATSGVGFVTGATMSNFTCLAAARDAVLRRHGWDVATRGLTGAPRVRVLVGAERHDTVDLALRYLGLGAPEPVKADAQGRIDPDALASALGEIPEGTPTIVVLQAGNVHSGAFDPFAKAIAAARLRGAWVHVDGAFGLFAAASPKTRHLTRGFEQADSWTTDAHKTLNVPYDSGVAIVADREALRAAMGMHGDYLIHDAAGDSLETVPEVSRRARAIPVWAVLRALGRDGVAALVERLCAHAAAFAEGIAAIEGARIANEVVFTQVCATFGTDERTAAVTRACSPTAPPGCPAPAGTTRRCSGYRSATGPPPTTTSPAAWRPWSEPPDKPRTRASPADQKTKTKRSIQNECGSPPYPACHDTSRRGSVPSSAHRGMREGDEAGGGGALSDGVRVLLISGSTRNGSANTAALVTVAALAPQRVTPVVRRPDGPARV